MGKVTKTEIFLLVLTLLFAALSAALFFTGRPQSEGYTVTAQRGDDSPRQPESCPLNINTATAGQLETLDGIGQVLAQRIVDYRNANGPFASVDDLLEVNGIGPGILETIRQGANAITITPPTTGELFAGIMHDYREKKL